jgi:hypothetical protein
MEDHDDHVTRWWWLVAISRLPFDGKSLGPKTFLAGDGCCLSIALLGQDLA